MSQGKALVVGIDASKNQPLPVCGNNANRIADILNARACGFDLRLLLDDHATGAAVHREVAWAMSRTDSPRATCEAPWRMPFHQRPNLPE
jgi:hypothetical protein